MNLRGGATVARLAHNQEVVGSIPTPVTNLAKASGCNTPRTVGDEPSNEFSFGHPVEAGGKGVLGFSPATTSSGVSFLTMQGFIAVEPYKRGRFQYRYGVKVYPPDRTLI